MLGHSQLATTPVPCSRGHPWPQSRRWHSTDSHQPSQVSPSHRSAWLGSAVPPCCVTGSGLGGTAVLLCPSSHLGDSAPSLGTAQRSEGDSFHPGTLWVPHWGCWLSSETQNKAQMLPLGDVNPVAVNPPRTRPPLHCTQALEHSPAPALQMLREAAPAPKAPCSP